jgi:hypothetical protein
MLPRVMGCVPGLVLELSFTLVSEYIECERALFSPNKYPRGLVSNILTLVNPHLGKEGLVLLSNLSTWLLSLALKLQMGR